MADYLSEDLRVRVIRAVEAGASRRQAAARFGVSVSSAVRWVSEWYRSGRTAPQPRGGDRRSQAIEGQRVFLLERLESEPDITLAELAEALRVERGVTVSGSAVWRFCRRHGMTLKKRQRMPASRTVRT